MKSLRNIGMEHAFCACARSSFCAPNHRASVNTDRQVAPARSTFSANSALSSASFSIPADGEERLLSQIIAALPASIFLRNAAIKLLVF